MCNGSENSFKEVILDLEGVCIYDDIVQEVVNQMRIQESEAYDRYKNPSSHKERMVIAAVRGKYINTIEYQRVEDILPVLIHYLKLADKGELQIHQQKKSKCCCVIV